MKLAMQMRMVEKIQFLKAEQCNTFREKLLNSKDKILIHNMETDAKWGCGQDGKGTNKMGKILMKVREKLLAHPTNESPNETIKNLLVIGNSNMRGLSTELSKQGVDATAFIFPGRSSAKIEERLPHCTTQTPPSHVVLHTGDIDVRQSLDYQQTLKAIQTARHTFPTETKLLVNAIPTGVPSRPLQCRIHAMNEEINELCGTLPNATFIHESSALRLRDNIHLSRHSVSKLATFIKNRV